MKTKLLSSIMAGAYISLGAMVYLMIPNQIVASLFFATGIFLVFNFKNMLFTRVCPLWIATGDYGPIDLVYAWVGNGIGAFLVALLSHFSRFEGKITERLIPICESKIADSPLSLFIMGIFCAVFVSYAVLTGRKHPTGSFAQIFYVWLFITAFVFCGFDHIVANMYYLSAYSLATGFDAAGVAKVFLCVTLGNIAGGVLIGYIDGRKQSA